MVVYRAKCHDGHYYIGSTQNLKKRMNGHFGKVCDKINHNKSADTFARYVASKIEGSNKVSANNERKLL